MSTLAAYFAFAEAHPALFVNPPLGGFTILLDEAEIREAEAQAAQRLEAQGLPAEWARVGIVYQDQYIMLLRDAVRFPDGSLGVCTRWGGEQGAPGVVVLPFYRGQVLLVRHFRHELRTWDLEIIQGFGMPGLSSEECARRELEEEIGATISRLVSLGQVHPDTVWGADYVELFYAEVESYGELEAQEGITDLLPTPVSELERMIREREVTNVFLLVAYTRAKLQGLL
jgi:ADP-ribose pyrophosphatase